MNYRSDLLNNILPFWLKSSIDYENSGIYTCLDKDGNIYQIAVPYEKSFPGLPHPNKAKRTTHANMAISITFLIPHCFKQNGISKIQNVSESWDMDINTLACRTPNVSAYSGTEAKLLINGLAKPLVICNATPSNTQKIKNTAIFCCLNRVKARKPNASTNDFLLVVLFTGHAGNV